MATKRQLSAEHLKEYDKKIKAEIRLRQPSFADYRLIIRQEPDFVEASEHLPGVPLKKKASCKDSNRASAHAIEPFPILELVIGQNKATNPCMNVNPLLFVYARLVSEDTTKDEKELGNQLLGGHAASIFRCKKDKHLQENGFFIFQDLRVKFPGQFRISYTLCEVVEDFSGLQYVLPCAHTHSKPFTVLAKGSPLPEPRAPLPVVKQIEGSGAKIRYRKPQVKKQKKSEQWSSSLQDIKAGKVGLGNGNGSKQRRGKPISLDADAITIGSVSMPATDADMFPTSTAGGYHTMQATMHDAPQLPQVPFTYSHPMPSIATDHHSLFESHEYAARQQLPAPSFSEGMLMSQYAMGGLPIIQNAQQQQQQVQTFQNQPFSGNQYQGHPSYLEGPPEQPRMMSAQYQPDMPPYQGGVYQNPMMTYNPGFDQPQYYPQQNDQDSQQQNQQNTQQQYQQQQQQQNDQNHRNHQQQQQQHQQHPQGRYGQG